MIQRNNATMSSDKVTVTVVILPPGRRPAFRYLSEQGPWIRDEGADASEPNEFGVDNFILDLRRDRFGRPRR